MIVSSEMRVTPEALAVSLALEACGRGERVLLVTADRTGSDALRRAFGASPLPSGVAIRSLAGLASRLLERAGERFRSGRLLGAFASRAMLETALDATPTPSYGRAARDSTRFREDVARVVRDLAPLDDAERARVAAVATPHLRDLLAVEARYRALLARAGAFDRAGLVARATHTLRDPAASATDFAEANVDTALFCGLEDYGLAGLELVAALAERIPRCTALEESAAALSDAGDDERGRAALARVRERVRTIAYATPSGAQSAIVEVIKARAPADEMAAIADRIEDALETGIAADRIGVVLRDIESIAPLIERELRARAIPVQTTESEAVRDDAAIGFLRATFALYADPREPGRWARVFGAPAVGADPVRVRLDLAEHPPDSLAATLARLRAFSNAGDEAIGATEAHVRTTLLAAHAAWNDDDLARAARILVRELALAAAVDGDERHAAAAVARVAAFIDALDQTQRALRAAGGDASCASIAARLDAHTDAIASDVAHALAEHGVRVVDVREAKVRDFDLTLVPGAVEGRFPRSVEPSPLFAPDDLAALAAARVDLPVARADSSARERRGWYVAVERGRRRTIVSYALADAEGRAGRPSHAIPLDVLPPSDALAYARPYELPSFDPIAFEASGPLDRLLARRVAAGFERAARRPVRTDAPLSVGSIDRWLQCPRKFYFDRLAAIPSDENTAMRFGSALHRVLERFHREEVDFRRVEPGDVARWTARLHALQDEIAPAIEPESPPLSEYSSFVLRRMLAGYADFLYRDAAERPFTVEACERPVEVPLGRAIARGRIDRLDRLADGSLAVRDYKSGTKKRAMAKALPEIAESIAEGERVELSLDGFSTQLPFYRLALADVGRLQVISFGGEGGAVRSHIADDDLTIDAKNDAAIAVLADYVRAHLAEPLIDGTRTSFPTTSDETVCRFCEYRRTCTGPRSIA
jgi:RecB family exonuclease